MAVHVFGIRHHGPGSARSLGEAMRRLEPDCVLIEGPPDGDHLIPLMGQTAMQPPVALLVHDRAEPTKAVYYPFAEFSPEWVAARHAVENGVVVRFMDLPITHQLAFEDVPPAEGDGARVRRDPLGLIAHAAGYEDSERWWEHMIEERRDATAIFEAIRLAMVSLRRELARETANEPNGAHEKREAMREAYMRKVIRAAIKEGHERIAVVCGAWHVPALIDLPPEKIDRALLRGLKKKKVDSTFIPWTYGRLSTASGYGAGVRSPGWYHHLYTRADDVVTAWMTRVARTLRDEGIDVSSAHVIEAVRLADAVASIRGRPLPGLDEMNEAIRAVMLFGDDLPLALVHQQLIIGQRLGSVPGDTPMVPLMKDLANEQRRLRLKPSPDAKDVVLDLRKPNDLARSALLRRLEILGVPWGIGGDRGPGLGTFKETWRLSWEPEYAVRLIEAGIHGGTILTASTKLAIETASQTNALGVLTALTKRVLLAELPDAVGPVLKNLEDKAAVATDLTNLLSALPELAQLVRYGDVRNTATDLVQRVLDELILRIAVGLPKAVLSLNEETAEEMFVLMMNAHGAIGLVDRHRDLWFEALKRIGTTDATPGLLRGRAVRLCFDGKRIDQAEVARRFSYALSVASEPAGAALFAEGFLRGSGQILVYDEELWSIVDRWLVGLGADAFMPLLPLLRRTFSTFSAPERRQMTERLAHGSTKRAAEPANPIDTTRADAVLVLAAAMLGIGEPSS